MKAEWTKTTLDEVCDFRGGGTPSKAVERYWQGNIPWVSPKDMKFDVVYDSLDHISDEAVQSSATSLIPKDSVLMVVRSGILQRIVPIALTGRDLTVNQDLKALCPKAAIHARFLYYVLKTKMNVLLSMVSRGATVHRLTTDLVRSLEFLLPPLPEQKRIVSILDKACDSIATAKANAEKNLQNARALFESHLEIVFTQRGEGWVEREMADICSKVTDGEHLRPKVASSGVPFLSAKDVLEHNVVFDDPLFVTEEDAKKFRNRCNPEKNDILIVSRGATVGRTCVVKAERVFCLLGSVILLKPEPNICSQFIAYALKSPSTRRRLETLSEASAQQAIYLRDIKSLIVACPSPTEQQKIVTALNLLAAETQRLESIYQQKLAALDALKKSLLHQAFTGAL